MITSKDIQESVDQAQPVFEQIQDLYRKLPLTTCGCEKPGVCCEFLPEMTLMEALQWFQVMRQMPKTERLPLVRKFVEFYLTTPVRRNGCPFRTEGYCRIYKYRTFACRAYGLWSQSMGAERTKKSREGKKRLFRMWRQYGIQIASDSILDEMDYCHQVVCNSGSKLSDDQLMTIFQQIYLLDNELTDLRNRFENEYHSDFSYLVTSFVLGTRKSVLGKFAVIKEICQEGTVNRLENMLAQIKTDGIISKI